MKWITFLLALYAAGHAFFDHSDWDIRMLASDEVHTLRKQSDGIYLDRNQVTEIAKFEAHLACPSQGEISALASEACDCH